MKKSKLIILALVTALSLTACKDPGALNQNSTPDNHSSQPQDNSQSTAEAPTSQPSEPSEPVLEFRINPDVISDLGLTYDQMVEKRGKLTSNTYKGVCFENGIGIYAWKSEGKSFFTVDHLSPGGLPNAGGCNWITGLNPEDLFDGLTYPVSMDIFSDKLGFVPGDIAKEKGIDNTYWSSFTHPMYENLDFIFNTDEYGMIDKDSVCTLSLNKDSLDFNPAPPTEAGATPRIRTEPLSDLGLTYDQMIEKRGEVLAESVKGIRFKNGLAMYGWKSDLASYTDYNKEGGCNTIFWLKPHELFEGLTGAITFEKLCDTYGLVPISIGKENGLYDCYASEFSHPEYKDVRYLFLTEKPGAIDQYTSCEISLAVDALNAKPVI